MNITQSKKLKLGDRIKWHGLDDSAEVSWGIVSEIGYNAFKVAYDDDQIDTYKFDEPHRLVCISKA